MARMSKTEESRRRGIVTTMENLPLDQIVQQHNIRFSWVRRRETEGGYRTPGKGFVPTVGNAFDIWLEEPPEDPPREPDAIEYSAHAAMERLLKYEMWVRTH